MKNGVPDGDEVVSRARRDILKLMTALPVAGWMTSASSAASAAESKPRPSAGPGQLPYDPQQLNPYHLHHIPSPGELAQKYKFIWADLRAFDNASPGFGSEEYLRNLGFKPDALFLLLSYPDFVFVHESASVDRPLEHRFTVYGGKALPTQQWTTFQLKGFIDSMHRRGVKVLASMFMVTAGGGRDEHDWFQQHPEVLVLKKDGTRANWANQLKHLKDGRLFEDVFLMHLTQCLASFGFDGYHAADGGTHLPVPLNEADFSDDMVDQFLKFSKCELPTPYLRQCELDVGALEARAGWILTDKNAEWVKFWRYRWGAYWTKIAKACKQNGLMVIANQPWTMPPYEAIYRYGFDYKVLEAAGIDALVVETVAGPSQLGGYTPKVGQVQSMWLEDATAMVLCVKAYVPNLPLVFLLCVQDENEQWDTLRLAPAFLEKEIFSYLWTFYMNQQGQWGRCLDGFVVCLGVGLSKADWTKLGEMLSRALMCSEPSGIEPEGVTAVWSDGIMETQLERHLTGTSEWPRPPLHSYVRNLSHEGAPLRTIVRIEHIQKVATPLFLVGAEWLGAPEHSGLTAWLADGGSKSLVVVGGEMTGFDHKLLLIQDFPEYGKTECAVIGGGHASEDARLQQKLSDQLSVYKPGSSGGPLILAADKSSGTFFAVTRVESSNFMERLPYLPLYRAFIAGIADAIKCIARAEAKATHGAICSLKRADGRTMIAILNDRAEYLWSRVSMEKPVGSIKILSFPYPRRPTILDDRNFDLRIAPDGIAVIDMQMQ